jgi:hypothetical protein
MVLASTRNNLLHGTWYVGFTGPEDLEAKEFYINKLSISKAGLVPLELPRTAGELRALTTRCEKVSEWIKAISMCFLVPAPGEGAERLKPKFKFDTTVKDWVVLTAVGYDKLP